LIEAYCGTFDGTLMPALRMYERMLDDATQRDEGLHAAWASVGCAKIRRRLGHFRETLLWIDQGIDAARKCGDRLSIMALLGWRALMRAETGDVHGGAADVRDAAPLLGTSSPSITTSDACAAIAEAALTISALQPAKDIDDIATAACASLSRSIRTFPSARAMSLLWSGVHHARHGRWRKAEQCWRDGLRAAERFALPYEEAMIRLQLGRAAAGTPRGAAHLQRSRTLFEQLDAARELQRVADALTSAPARRA